MPAVLVRNLSVKTHLALKRRAKLHGSSTEAEIRGILDAAVRPEAKVGLGTQLQELGRKYGGWDLDIKRDQTPTDFAIFE
jgi:antitoxin FitA